MNPSEDDRLSAEWERRVIELEPRVLEAQKKRKGEAKWMTLFTSAQDLGSEGEFARAIKVLDQLERLLNAPPKAPDAGGDGVIVKLQKSRLEWDQTRKAVTTELQGLEKAIVAACQAVNDDPDDEDEIDMSELAAKTKELYNIMTKLDERLIDKLDEALNAAAPAQRDQKQKEAAAIIKEYQTTVDSDPLVAAIDQSGFLNTTIKQRFTNVLKDLASKL